MFCSPFRRRRRRKRRMEEVEERQLTREEAWHLYLAKECLDISYCWTELGPNLINESSKYFN